MALSKSYSRKRKYYYKLPNENPEFKLFLNDFQKATYSFYFQNTLLTLLHLVLIKRFLNMSNVDTKIQRLLIPSLLSEQFQSFTKFPPFSSLGEKIYKIKIIPWYVTQFSCLVMVPLLKDFFWYYSHPILCHLAKVLPILFTLNWNLVLFSCHENHQKRSFLWWEGSFCPDIKSIIILLNGVYRNDCLYYSGLCTTRNALSREWLYKTVGTYAFLSRYLMPIYNIYPNMWVPAISTFYYLIIAIQSVMKILSTKIKNVVCYYR